MKELRYATEQEMQAAMDAANAELAPTFLYCGQARQAWFDGWLAPKAKKLPWRVYPGLLSAACTLPACYPVEMNSPTSALAMAFIEMVRDHVGQITFRKAIKGKHKSGRPKQSAKGGES